jgi:hypothetical protein
LLPSLGEAVEEANPRMYVTYQMPLPSLFIIRRVKRQAALTFWEEVCHLYAQGARELR